MANIFFLHHGLGDVVISLYSLKSREVKSGDLFVVKGEVEAECLRLAFNSKISTLLLSDYPNISQEKSLRGIYWLLLLLKLRIKNKYHSIFFVHSVPSLSSALASLIFFPSYTSGPRSLHPIKNLAYSHVSDFNTHSKYSTQASILGSKRDASNSIFDQNAFPLRSSSSRQVILAPLSNPSEKHKRWPLSYYLKLALRIVDRTPYSILFMGGPGDVDVLNAITSAAQQDHLLPSRFEYCASTSLKNTLTEISRSRIVVGNCSAIVHLAAALQVETIAIYGPTDPRVTGPPASNYFTYLQAAVPCAPCYKVGFEHGCPTPHCMTSISVDNVYNTLCDRIDS